MRGSLLDGKVRLQAGMLLIASRVSVLSQSFNQNMQFNLGSTTSGSTGQTNANFDFNQNLSIMMAQHQRMMTLLYEVPRNLNNQQVAQAPEIYNQKVEQSIILVNHANKKDNANATMFTQSSDGSQTSSDPMKNNASKYNSQVLHQINNSHQKAKSQQMKAKKRFETEEQYSPEDEEAYDFPEPKISESKNIPKIFGKSILNFISKNRAFTLRVLHSMGCDESDFELSLDYFKNHMSSIADLRNLWLDQQNKFAKIYRILSKEYLRKHSLVYIFNSRVTSLAKHIKYRNKIEKSIESPSDFTSMKEY